MNNVVGKQAIFDKNKNIVAYELLYRCGSDNFCSMTDGAAATYDVLNNIFTTGLKNITQGKRGFINFSTDLIKDNIIFTLPKELVVIEILEDVIANDEIMSICEKLQTRGYKLALDDFCIKDMNNPLLKYVDIVKVDFPKVTIEERKMIVESMKSKNITCLAEKVESYEELEEAIVMGFDYFQGFCLSMPEIIFI